MDKCKNAYNPSKVSMYIDSQKNKTLMDNYYTIDEINDILDGKIDLDSVYTKVETYNREELYTREEVEYLLSLKANKVDVYSKIDSKTLLDLKANKNEIYDKNEIDEILDGYYTKLYIDTILENKADIEDVIAISGQVLTNIEDIEYLEANKQDKLIAGDNITISGNVISADLNDYLKTEDASNTYETIENVNSLSDIVSGHTGDISDLEENKADKATTLGGYGIEDAYTKTEIDTNLENYKIHSDILYADLLALIANDGLIPGQKFRITDYTTTTVQADTQSAGHNFDIIVEALDETTLSENAKCVRKDGDTYFTNANLESWEIKYCIHNDTSRFEWAKTTNGKGVIYYMKDEWNNECPYDFKNIKFKKDGVWLYTFGGTTDDSLTGGCHHNTMMDYVSSSVLTLNFNTFGSGCYSNTFGTDCYDNKFGNECYSNTFGNYCSYNKFGDNCDSNTFGNYCEHNEFGDNCDSNTFGNICDYNTFDDSCYSNTFGNYCYSNTFGTNCYSNTFGNSCDSNTFGDDCCSNTFGNDCKSNTFGYGCFSNTFGDYCRYNNFGNNCNHNTFGNSCRSNKFYHGSSGTTPKNYMKFIVLEDGVSYNNFYSKLTTSSSSYLKRIRIKGLENTTQTDITISLSATNTKYEWLICYTSGNVLKQYCPNN